MNKEDSSTLSKQFGCITINCMNPEYRQCLDKIMSEWDKHRRKLPRKIGRKRYVPGIYGFAYWLIRWSGLVQPSKINCPATESNAHK